MGRVLLRGSVLSYGTFLGSKILLYVATLILARLLAPRDFGLVGLGLLVISFLDVISDLGIPEALVYRQDAGEAENGEVFTLSQVAGIAFFLLTWLLAPVAASFFHDARLEPMVRLLGFTFPLAALGDVHVTLLQKDFHFGRRYLPDLALAVVKGSVSVLLALHGLGYWSLVWGQLAGMAARAVVAWLALPWLPHFAFRRSTAHAILAFGAHLSLVNILGVLLYNGDYLIVGRVLGASALGVYTLAYTLPQMVTINLVVALSAVVFPAYARVQGDARALRDGYRSVLTYTAWLLFPVALGMFAITPALVHTLYRTVWYGAIPVMQALSLYGLLYSLGWNAGDIFKAMGRPDILWKIALFHVCLLLPALLLGALLRGIVGVALAHVAVAVPYCVVRFWVTGRILHLRLSHILGPLAAPGLASLFMVLAVLSIGLVSLPPTLLLMVQIVVGALLYVGILVGIDRDARHTLTHLPMGQQADTGSETATGTVI